jgi:hypothetical protein
MNRNDIPASLGGNATVGRTKEFWLEQFEAEAAAELLDLEAEAVNAGAKEAEGRLALEREWAAKYPGEWSEWVRIHPLLTISIDFASGESYDFPQFLTEVGRRPSPKHVIRRRDKTSPYQQGNLVWGAKKVTKSNYLTYKDVQREFGIKKTALYRLRAENKVESVKVPGVGYLFPRAGLERLMRNHAQTPTDKPRATTVRNTTAPIRKRTRRPSQRSPGSTLKFL